jgi:hypothetical protein
MYLKEIIVAKGGSFEREIAKLLSLWWSDGEREDIFGRSDGSGGRFTQRRKAGKSTANMAGDLTFTDSIGEPLIAAWSIELKTGYGKKTDTGVSRWDCLDFLDSRQKEPVLQKMWEQCRRDAELTNRIPILIFRRNGRSPCIMFRSRYFRDLEKTFGDYLDMHLIVKTTFYCVIMPLQSFLEWIPNIRAALGGDKCSSPSQLETSKPIKKAILRSTKVST